MLAWGSKAVAFPFTDSFTDSLSAFVDGAAANKGAYAWRILTRA